jgi:hypothetical protein
MDTASRPRHQDDDPDAFLDRWATLNIEMDEDAKVHWAKHLLSSLSIHDFRGTLGLWWKDKDLYELHSTLHTYLRTGKSGLLGKHGNLGMARTGY